MKITRIRTTPVLAPLPRPLRTASGNIERFPLVLIDVITDDGVEGHAYAQVYLPELLPALDRTVAALGDMIVGMPLAPRDLHAHLLRRCRLFGAKGMTGVALGGLDMALWDAWARARHEPLARALGGELRPLKAYNSVGLYDAAAVVEVAHVTREGGYAGLKIKAGFPELAQDLAAVRAARQALGDGIALMVDYNQSLDPAEAMRRCLALDDEGLAWIEEPVLAGRSRCLRTHRRRDPHAAADRRELPWSRRDARGHRSARLRPRDARRAVHPRRDGMARSRGAGARRGVAHVLAHVRRGERAASVRHADCGLDRGAGLGRRTAAVAAGFTRWHAGAVDAAWNRDRVECGGGAASCGVTVDCRGE